MLGAGAGEHVPLHAGGVSDAGPRVHGHGCANFCLVTKEANSPHLLIAKTNATYLVCQAQNDDMQQPQMKEDLKAAFVAAKRPATVEVYQANHGWCVKGGAVYNEGEAERAWAALTKLYQSNLV